MKDFWDEKYSQYEYLFGIEPDTYLAEKLPNLSPGKILFPGEGEGRNAVYAAKQGWQVTAFDYSNSAKIKAEKLANINNVNIEYLTLDITEKNFPNDTFDAIAYLFIHFEGEKRKAIHKAINAQLKVGGILILECFSDQQPIQEGKGPRSSSFLYSKANILEDFPNYDVIELTIDNELLKEGPSEMGESSILRFIGKKIS